MTAQAFDADQFNELFPEDYEFFLISEHTTCSTWRLSAIAANDLTTIDFGNVLAAPREAHHVIAHSVRREASGRGSGG